MAFNANGQISYLVLKSLSDGSKYGLEIIEYISQISGGNYLLKKPTLYSCLSRMEKKGLVSSSFWGESELGGKRHYYTITAHGKKALEVMTAEFESLPIGEFETEKLSEKQTLKQGEIEEKTMHNKIENENLQNENIFDKNETKEELSQNLEADKPIILQQDNIFDLVKENKQEKTVEDFETENENVLENQLDIFNYQPNEASEEEKESVTNPSRTPQSDFNEEKMEYYKNILEQEPKESVKNDAKFLDETEKLTPFQEEQNRRIYDTSNELKRYRKRKSFSENQIEMAVVYENAEERELQKQRIEQLKASMLNARQNVSSDIFERENSDKALSNELDEKETQKNFEEKETQEDFFYKKPTISEEVVDDARFITEPKLDETKIPIQKKITPPNIDVNIYDDDLPAPKRNSNLEPTYKDMMAKLFERKKEKASVTEQVEPVSISQFADYDTLKKYYASHGIEFKEYRKTTVERHHNTNFLRFINSTILLLLSGIGSAIIFGIVSALGLLKPSTNFMYYTLPLLFLLYSAYEFIKFKLYPSKKAALIYNGLVIWSVFLLTIVISFIFNVIGGMQYETMSQFLTSLLVPIWGLFLILPVNFHIKQFLYKKYSK